MHEVEQRMIRRTQLCKLQAILRLCSKVTASELTMTSICGLGGRCDRTTGLGWPGMAWLCSSCMHSMKPCLVRKGGIMVG